MATTNGHLQGSAFSIDDIKMLTYVWAARHHRVIPISLSITYIDDSNSTVWDMAGIRESLRESLLFDKLSGQELHLGKL
eukprot:2326730-Pyramimonas_sp.AAC.1